MLTSVLSLLGLGAPAPVELSEFWMMPSAVIDPVSEVRLGEVTLMAGSGLNFPSPDQAISIKRQEQAICASQDGILPHRNKLHLRFGFALEVDTTHVRSDAFCVTHLNSENLHMDMGSLRRHLQRWKDNTLLEQIQSEAWPSNQDFTLKVSRMARTELSTQLSAVDSISEVELRASKPDSHAWVGEPLELMVTYQGRPLVGQAVIMLDARNQHAYWGESDEQGLLSFNVPHDGTWLFKGAKHERPAESASTGGELNVLLFNLMVQARHRPAQVQ